MGLRIGEIEGPQWEHYHHGELFVARSIWNGRITEPKTKKSAAPVPVIAPLRERLEMHRQRCGNPQAEPIFANSLGKPLNMNNVLGRQILPALNRCVHCGRPKGKEYLVADHDYQRDPRLPEWRGWHAARRGLGSNLYRLGVPSKVIQLILRHANVSTTESFYIKPTSDDVRSAMAKFENSVAENLHSTIPGSVRTLKLGSGSRSDSVN